MTKKGRRRGPTSSREAILHAARRRFSAAGYDATSIRAIAADAGVDPAVVMHFFGSKDGLFQAAVGWPFDPALFASRIAGPREDIGARVARAFLGFWEEPSTRASLMAVLRSAMTHETSAALMREFFVRQLVVHVSDLVDAPRAEMRAQLAASHLIGVAVLRYVLRVEPIASAGTDELVTWLTPALAYYLDPETPEAGESGPDISSVPRP